MPETRANEQTMIGGMQTTGSMSGSINAGCVLEDWIVEEAGV